MLMTPNFEAAAVKATECLIRYGINTAPVMPLPILKKMPGVLVVSFTEMSQMSGIDRHNLVTMFGNENQDAVTSVYNKDGRLVYLVTFNQRLPIYMIQRSLAREMGHIVLGHDGSLPEDVRLAEAQCFAYHLICPRPLVQAVRESGIRFSIEVLGNMTGCYERCIAGMRKTPGVHVPPELNRKIKEQFSDYLTNYLDYQTFVKEDETPISDFGTYMDGYEE
jgi:hypothetical protein